MEKVSCGLRGTFLCVIREIYISCYVTIIFPQISLVCTLRADLDFLVGDV